MDSEAIIIRSVHYGEKDLILTFMSSQHGKVSAFFKHGKNKTGTTAELFDYGLINFTQKSDGLKRLKSFIPKLSFPGLRTKLEFIACASFICEVFDHLLPEDDDTDASQLFNILLEYLRGLNSIKITKESLRASYLTLVNILAQLGYLDLETPDSPSYNNLLKLIRIVETETTKPLKTTELLLSLAKQVA